MSPKYSFAWNFVPKINVWHKYIYIYNCTPLTYSSFLLDEDEGVTNEEEEIFKGISELEKTTMTKEDVIEKYNIEENENSEGI